MDFLGGKFNFFAESQIAFIFTHFLVAINNRLIAHWVKAQKKFSFIVTNLYDRKIFPIEDMSRIYRLRWQIELFFKEWKSNNGLRKFNTRNPDIVRSLILGSLISLLLKRLITYCASKEGRFLLSTLKSSRAFFWHWANLFEAIINERKVKIKRILKVIMKFLINNAKISHPKRDARSGKLQYGIDSSCFMNCKGAAQ